MYRSILVPLDGSTFSEPAIPYALELARRSRGRIHLAHVYAGSATEAVPDLELPRGWTDTIRAERQDYLSSMAERIRRASDVEVEPALREGLVVVELRALAREVSADLVVMTTHGRGGVSRAWLGSVADRFLRAAELPLLLIRPDEDQEELDLAHRVGIRNIVVPLDGSELAEHILDAALALGEGEDASYTLLRIVPDPGLADARGPSVRFRTIVDEERRLRRQREESASEYLDRIANRMRGEAIEVDFRVLFDDDTPGAILRFAEESGADAIALATHGRGGVARALIGSVADKVIRSAHLPVLVHRPPES